MNFAHLTGLLVAGFYLSVASAFGQDKPLPQPPAQAPPPSETAAPPASDQPAFSSQELEQMLAPVALYPDSLLTQIFMASTYPTEVVEADRWVKENPDLKGDALATELE